MGSVYVKTGNIKQQDVKQVIYGVSFIKYDKNDKNDKADD